MYEQHTHRLITRRAFVGRVARHMLLAWLIIVVGLGIGVMGYHFLDGLSWIDSLVNASMILGGMGPVDPLKNDAAKLFASFYALFSGLAFIAIATTLVAPFVHRLLHRFHLDQK